MTLVEFMAPLKSTKWLAISTLQLGSMNSIHCIFLLPISIIKTVDSCHIDHCLHVSQASRYLEQFYLKLLIFLNKLSSPWSIQRAEQGLRLKN